MKRLFVIAALCLLLTSVGCRSITPIGETPTITATITKTATSMPTFTDTPQPTPTRLPTLTATASPTPFTSNDPLLDEILQDGFIEIPILRFALLSPADGATFFSNLGEYAGNIYGGPDFDYPRQPDHLATTGPDEQTYAMKIYAHPEGVDCRLVFFHQQEGENRVIGDFQASDLNSNIGQSLSIGDELFPTPLFCLAERWSDVNENGKPDIAVTLLWANNYNGGEVRIFEVMDNDAVVDLTAELPGYISHWEFSYEYPEQIVMDISFADHDCIYPLAPYSYWIFRWNGEAYVDVTASGDYVFTNAIDYFKQAIEPYFGGPFIPEQHLGPIVSVLLMYDKSGEREKGWQEFLELTDLSHWPETTAENLQWLQADIAHFKAEYDSDKPFTPNHYAAYCNQ